MGALLPRGATAFEGLHPDAPWKPGKLDLHFDRTDATERYNAFWWSPVIKVGAGVLDTGELETQYGGGYARVEFRPKLELIAGVGLVDRDDLQDVEFQAELRTPIGLGLGGGTAGFDGNAPDIVFGKAVHRGHLGHWNSILVFQLQEYGDETSPGGYAGLYEDRFFAVVGDDGEQRQATLAYVASPDSGSPWRPVLEGIWLDQGIGDVVGAESFFINGTLGFRGTGFLSHPARLGRAMGPTGVEFANPLGFLWPLGPWNRRLDPWELGGLGDFRVLHVQRPNGVTVSTWEALIFPLQIARRPSRLDGIFVGATYRTLTGTDDDPGALAGFIGKAGFLLMAVAADYGFESDDFRATIGLIDPF